MELGSFYITCTYHFYYKPNLIGGKSGKKGVDITQADSDNQVILVLSCD